MDPQEKVGKKVKKPAAKKAAAKKAAAKKTSTKKVPTAKKTAKGPAGKKVAVKKPKSPKKVKAAKKVENPRVKATPKSAKAKKAAPKNLKQLLMDGHLVALLAGSQEMAPASNSLAVVDCVHTQTAVSLVLPGELAKHAVSEWDKGGDHCK
uniref:uncharacterized protein n=1 Tax=Pristiophorus japonicus TaxID=55135 RepID=UPI00398F83B8